MLRRPPDSGGLWRPSLGFVELSIAPARGASTPNCFNIKIATACASPLSRRQAALLGRVPIELSKPRLVGVDGDDSSTTDLREAFLERRVLLRDGIEMAKSPVATAIPARRRRA